MNLQPLAPMQRRTMNVAQLEKDHPWWKWLFGRPAYIVMLFCILASVGYGAWYGIPAAIIQIQAGYESLDKRHIEERAAAEARHAAERKEMRDDAKQDRVQFQQAIEKHTQAIERLTEGLAR
jgi:hypothetical protein